MQILFFLSEAYFLKKNFNEALETIKKCLKFEAGNYKAESLKQNIQDVIDKT